MADFHAIILAAGRSSRMGRNNAGILLGRENPIETLGMDDVRNTFEVNLFGPINVVKHLRSLR